jgi:hypothetical protein
MSSPVPLTPPAPLAALDPGALASRALDPGLLRSPCIARRALLAAAALALAACGGARPPVTPAPAAGARSPVLRFAYDAVDGRPISTEEFANRISVLGFLTTYDVPSQVEARVLASLVRHHAPRINVAALMLEAGENKPLVEAFAKMMALPYPVAIADAATIGGDGPFTGLNHVPSVVILDREGREAWRHVGFVDEAALDAALRAVEKR